MIYRQDQTCKVNNFNFSKISGNPFLKYQSYMEDITAPLTTEYHQISLEIEGIIPHEINGCYYRNGPNQKQKPYSYHHLVDGNGMIHQFKISQGNVIYTNRWIKNKIFRLEDKFQRGLTGSFLRPFNSDNRVKNLSSRERTKSNTHVFQFAEKILAFEEGGVPYILNEHTLETVGVLENFLKYKTTLTGHPKYCQIDKKLYCVNWNSEPHYVSCTFLSINEKGFCENYTEIQTPYRSFIHDFAMTQNYIIIPLFPCVVDYEKARLDQSADVLTWKPELGAKLGIMNKKNPQSVKWIDIDLFYAMHTCNAYETNNAIILDLIIHNSPPILHNEFNSSAQEKIRAQLGRISIDLNKNNATITLVDDLSALYSFPRINEQYLGYSYEQVFACMTNDPQRKGMLYNPYLVCFDYFQGTRKQYYHGEGWFFSEPVYIPGKFGLKNNYIITLVSHYHLSHSELLFFNADNIERGPLAKSIIPHMIPYGFHGNWCPA